MGKIERYEVHEEWNHSGLVKAGDYCFLSYCVGNIGGTIEEQINGAFDNMEERLAMVGLTLENVVQMACSSRRMQLRTAVNDEPETFPSLDIMDQRLHHEIYLNDARKVAPEKLKTVIRHPIKKRGE